MYTANDYRLYHHGIKGQKWGAMHGPPYPLDDSISTGNKLRETAGRIKEHMRQRAEARAVKREERRVQKEERAAQKFEEKKAKTLRSGDFNKVTKMRDDLTDDELRSAISRIKINQELASLEPASRFDRAMDKVNNFRMSAEKGINAWNTFAKVVNSFDEDGGVLPVLDGKWAKEKADREEKAYNDALAASKKEKEAAFVRKSTREEFLKNANKLSDEALKSRAEREKNLDTVRGKEKAAKKEQERAKWDDNKQLEKEPENEYDIWARTHYSDATPKRSTAQATEKYHHLTDDEVEVLGREPMSASTSSRGTESFNRAWNAAQIESRPVFLLEDKQRRAS